MKKKWVPFFVSSVVLTCGITGYEAFADEIETPAPNIESTTENSTELTDEGSAVDNSSQESPETSSRALVGTIHRLYNRGNGDHIYTQYTSEVNNLKKAGWKYEGITWYEGFSCINPIYRVYNPKSGEHFYTMSKKERNGLVQSGWKGEGEAFLGSSGGPPYYVSPVYRLFNPKATKADSHVFTLSDAEKNNLVKLGWKNEGISWYSKP